MAVKWGWASLDAARHRDFALMLFARRGNNVLTKDALRALLPNGDWRKVGIELFIGAGLEISEKECVNMVTNGLITALLGSMFEKYERHRWVGPDLAADRCGLLESVQCL